MSKSSEKKKRKLLREEIKKDYPALAKDLLEGEFKEKLEVIVEQKVRERMRMVVRPKPKYVPSFVWELLKRIVLTV